MFMKRAFSVLNKNSISSVVKNSENAVRGPVAIRAIQMKKEMATGKKFKFEKLVPMHSGNPQALGQPPITFGREVLSIMMHHQFGQDVSYDRYSVDAVDRARHYLENMDPQAIGAYAGKPDGYDPIKKEVIDFIRERDGVDVDPSKLYLSTGASEAIEIFLRLLINDPNDAVMIPTPNYPLYSACCVAYGGQEVRYGLDENNNWALNLEDLQKSYQDAKDRGLNPKGIAVLNPGNPTGQVLTKQNLKDVIEFAYENNLLVIADEVYQANVYNGNEFHSMRGVMEELGDPIKSKLEMVSMHSVSKGFTGECGLRGGYFEFTNLDSFAEEMIYKLKAIKFCAPTPGMIAVGTMVNPPKEGVNSPEVVSLYNKEKDHVFGGLQRKAGELYEKLNNMEGITTNETQGALYSFARLHLPEKFIAEADSLGIHPDLHFCLNLLEETGMITVPGSGFGQEEGTAHIRMTNLIYNDKVMDDSMANMHKMVSELHGKYS